jgi:hypothetical protein
MENPRPLVYEVPHKAIRNALSQFSLLAGNTDYNDKGEMEKLKNLADEIFKILDSHAKHENNVPLKYLEQKLSGGSVHDKEDHERIESEMYKLEEALKDLYERSENGEELRYPGNDFYEQLTDFHAQYLQHMLEEERETQPLLWKYFTDEELKQHEMEIRSAITPEEMLLWAKYMFPAFSDSSRIEMLRSISAAAPPQFYEAVLKVAESVLPADVFKKLKKEI